ncbi:MAG: autotransporter domain-containing protein, partial [Endomicrobia bacterium]|nr:autotransporter domain-containing protein [Endomicrobiia bacterium]
YIDGNEAHGTSSINGNGGAIYAATDISFTGAGAAVTASSNTAYGNGGAFYALGNVSFAGGAVFDRNTLTTSASTTVFHNGGAIWAGGNVSFSSASAVIQLSKNVAVDNGGAIYSSSGSVTFAGSANMSGNYVTNKSGGAIWAFGNISFTNNNALLSISSNSCILTAGTGGDGGAFYSSSGVITVNSYVQAVGNSAKNGGVFYSNGVMIRDGGEFSGNKAIGGDGGAIYINGDGNHRISSMSALTRDLIFENNTSSGGSVGNDIFLTGDANLVFYSSGVAGDTVTCRSITLGSGISYKGSSTTVLKDGNGKLILNGGSYFYNFNFKAGMVQTGAAAVFHSTAAVFSAGTFFDMRNGNNSDKVLIDTFTCSGKIYYDINSNSGASDVIETKTAKMAGSVIKVGLSGTDASTKTYTIVTAGANQGSGQMTIDNTNVEGRTMTRVNSSITYDSGNSASWSKAYINVHINQLSAIVGLTGNQMQSALALDRDYGTATGDLFTIIDGLDREPSENAKKEALNDLSGHIYANALTLPGLNIVKDNVLSRLKRSYFLADQNDIKRDLWVQGFTANNTYKGDKNSPGDFKSSNSGFQAGFDTLKYDKQIFGITAGYAKTSASQNRDTVDIEGYSLGGYGSYFFDNNFEARFLLMGGRQNYSASRSIRYLGRKTAAEYDGYSMNVSAELDYERFLREDLYMRPFASVSGAYVMTNAFSESGLNAEGKQSAANLAVNSDSYSRADLNLGFQVNNGTQMRLKWYGEIKMDLLVAGRTGEFTAQYENTGNSLDVVGIENDIVNFVLGAGVLYDISKSFSAYANVSGAFSGTQTGYYGNIGVNYKFATTYNDFYERSR